MGMAFEYTTTSGMAITGTNPALGSVIMATNYDVYAPKFDRDTVRMLNHFYVAHTAPYKNALHLVECAPVQTPIKPLLIRDESSYYADVVGGPNITTTSGATWAYNQMYDARLYDHGRVEVLGIGNQSELPVTVGKLWITYDIILFKPKVTITGGVRYESNYSIAPVAQSWTTRIEIPLAAVDEVADAPPAEEEEKVVAV